MNYIKKKNEQKFVVESIYWIKLHNGNLVQTHCIHYINVFPLFAQLSKWCPNIGLFRRLATRHANKPSTRWTTSPASKIIYAATTSSIYPILRCVKMFFFYNLSLHLLVLLLLGWHLGSTGRSVRRSWQTGYVCRANHSQGCHVSWRSAGGSAWQAARESAGQQQ